MKRCPTCEKTYDDALRFCQADGTPLVAAAEEVDPYKTMVARPEDIASAIGSKQEPKQEQATEVSQSESHSASEEITGVEKQAGQQSDDLLQIPGTGIDPKKTMYASEAEIRAAMSGLNAPEENVVELPPIGEPAPPQFIEQNIGESKSPEREAKTQGTETPSSQQTTPAIPSPFEASQPSPTIESKFEVPMPEPPAFVVGSTGADPAEPSREAKPAAEAEPPSPFTSGMEFPSAQAKPIDFSQATASAAPGEQPAGALHKAEASQISQPKATKTEKESNMQNPQQFGQAAPASPNQTLAIVSLVVGILSLLCCSTVFIPGIVAIVLGFMARGKANSDPKNYGGAGLALGGIITGALSLVVGIVIIVLYLFLGFGSALLQGIR